MLLKKLSTGLLASLMAVSALTGCTSSPSTTEPSKEPSINPASTPAADAHNTAEKESVELTLWITSREQDDFMAQREQRFLDQYPHITLNKVLKEGDPGNELYQAVAAGNAPDCIEVSFTMMDKYIKADILAPINTYMDAWDEGKNYTQSYTDMFTKDGKLYGLPTDVAPMYFGYNKALFNEIGLTEAPKTWDETLEIAKKLSIPEKQQYGFGTLAAEWTEWFFQYFVWQAGGDLTIQNPDDTLTLTFTDPAVIKAAEFYQTLRRDGLMQSDLTLKFGDLTEKFAQGKIAMMPFAGDWVSMAISQGANPSDIGLSLFPAGPSGAQTTAIAGSCFVIPSTASDAEKDAAWEYISFMNSADEIKALWENRASKGAANPTVIPRDDLNAADLIDLPKEYAKVLEDVKEVGRLEFYGKAQLNIYVDRAVQKILTDPNADPLTEFTKAQELAQKEVVDKFNEDILANK